MPRVDAVRFSIWLALCALLATSSAWAQPIALHWRAPEGCPSERELTQELLALLSAPAAARATLEIVVTRLADGSFEGRLSVRSAPPAPPRVLQAASCESIARAAILIGALTVDAMETIQPPTPKPRLRVAVRLAGDHGALPAVSLAPGALVGAQWGRLSVDAGVLGFLPRRARLDPEGAQGGVFSLAVGTLRGCHAWLVHDFAFAACAGGELGVLRGTGDHLSQPRSARGAWAALSAGALVRHTARSGLFSELSLEALLALRRPRFEIDALGELFQSERVLARLSIGLGWTFL